MFRLASGKTIWRYLASRVKREVNGHDRFAIKDAAMQDERNWSLSVQEARQRAVEASQFCLPRAPFPDCFFLTVYSFARSRRSMRFIHRRACAGETEFPWWVFLLALLWGVILILAVFGLLSLLGP
jgi:hypothetical protein